MIRWSHKPPEDARRCGHSGVYRDSTGRFVVGFGLMFAFYADEDDAFRYLEAGL